MIVTHRYIYAHGIEYWNEVFLRLRLCGFHKVIHIYCASMLFKAVGFQRFFETMCGNYTYICYVYIMCIHILYIYIYIIAFIYTPIRYVFIYINMRILIYSHIYIYI